MRLMLMIALGALLLIGQGCSAEKQEVAEKHRQLTVSNMIEGEVFLAENAKKESVITLPSGLQYKIIKEGTGKNPADTDKMMMSNLVCSA